MKTREIKKVGFLVLVMFGSIASAFQLPNSYINLTEAELTDKFQQEYNSRKNFSLLSVDEKLFMNPEFRQDFGVSSLNGRKHKGYSIDRSRNQLVGEKILPEDNASLYSFGTRSNDPSITIQTPKCIDKGSFNDPNKDCSFRYGSNPRVVRLASAFYVVVLNDGTEILLSSKLIMDVRTNYSVNDKNTVYRLTVGGKKVSIEFVDSSEVYMKVKSAGGDLIGDMSFGSVL